MKQLIISILFLTIVTSCKSQKIVEFDYNNFEKQVLSYEPIQNSNTIKKDFDFGKMVLRETKIATENNYKNFNGADYYNILSAFTALNESEINIQIAFEKFKNSEGSCDYFLSKRMFKSPKYDIIREKINQQIQICENSTSKNQNRFDLKEYSQKNNFDYNLILQINNINDLDEKYRNDETTDWTKQTPIDKENQRIIDSLYNVHKTYLGKTLVGEKFQSTMWRVIQHSNIEMMEKYLPIIQKAVNDNELDVVPFKMLIDRIYSIKFGYQIFGSQGGIDIADDEKRKEVELKYGIK